tara:strand:- start:787 stop:1605 length:819 start_codon:yes stop_codon:yes gene_type:complete
MERFKVVDVPHLEWHVTHSCNFTCQGCGHFTNDGYKEDINIDQLKSWYLPWVDKIRPRSLCMLGGEPLLNKDLVEIIYMTKEVWNIESDQEFEIVSNGLLIETQPDLPKALSDTNCILTITKHSDDEKYIKLFDRSIKNIESLGIKYRIHDAVDYWLKTHVGYGPTIEPIGSDDFKESWDNCPGGQENFILQDSKIYKCAALAYLPIQKKKYGDKLSPKWNPYLKYIPLSPDGDIEKFFSRKAEIVCSMCPKKSGRFKKPSPLYSPRHYGIL